MPLFYPPKWFASEEAEVCGKISGRFPLERWLESKQN
jgi:hypothetical protein